MWSARSRNWETNVRLTDHTNMCHMQRHLASELVNMMALLAGASIHSYTSLIPRNLQQDTDNLMGFAVHVRSAGQKYGPTCHQTDRADITEFVTLVRLSSLGQHVGVLALAGYKRRKSALAANPIAGHQGFRHGP